MLTAVSMSQLFLSSILTLRNNWHRHVPIKERKLTHYQIKRATNAVFETDNQIPTKEVQKHLQIDEMYIPLMG